MIGDLWRRLRGHPARRCPLCGVTHRRWREARPGLFYCQRELGGGWCGCLTWDGKGDEEAKA